MIVFDFFFRCKNCICEKTYYPNTKMHDEGSSEAVVEKNVPEKENNESLEDVLNKNGLDPKFWSKKFEDLGIEKSTQLQHADRSVLKKLSQQKEFPWQENALRACFPSLNKNLESKQEVIDKMKNLSEEKLAKLDEVMDEKTRSEKMQIKMQMPEDQRELHEKLTNMKFDRTELEKRDDITPTDMIYKISAGRILRGYYLSKDVLQSVLPRKQLISLGDGVTILAPRMEETFMSLEFFDEEKSGNYDHVMQHWGSSSMASVGATGIFAADIAQSTTSTNEEKNSMTGDISYTEIKETVIVPMASFVLENTCHFLSTEAVNELTKLEKNITEENKHYLCRDFFKKFGSHYFVGTYHFGGRYTRSAICKTQQKMSTKESLTLTKSALQANAGGMIDWFSAGCGYKNENSKDASTSKVQDEVDSRVTKKLVKCGGPPEADSIREWKIGLVKYPATWSIIDQDVHKNEWKGVWELLTDDLSSKIENIQSLREALKGTSEVELQAKNEVKKEVKKEVKITPKKVRTEVKEMIDY